jgi:hypothetical protein
MPISRFLVAFGALAASVSLAQGASLKLVAPLDYQVIQRQSPQQGTIHIAGELTGSGASSVAFEIRVSDSGKDGDWRPQVPESNGPHFLLDLPTPAGGWYRLDVRAIVAGQVIAEQSVPHVGVGEIFVVAGQSNSANYGEEKQQTKTRRVAAFDGRQWQLADDPEPGAGGERGSFLPPLGDALVDHFRVPVGFVACGIGGSSVREWLPAGAIFPNPPTVESRVRRLADGTWESNGAAFAMLVGRMKPFGPHGFRAVLWHQGESDANQKDTSRTLPGSLYREYLENIIRESRREIGWDAPWFVAQASYHGPADTGSPDIRSAQKSVSGDGWALEGPDSDTLQGDLRENSGRGVHLTGPGLVRHAALWSEKIVAWLERQLDDRVSSPAPHP